jgi:hypothetical protein
MLRPANDIRIAIDFDGTLVTQDSNGDFYATIGAKEALEMLVAQGYHIIIHTCRTGIAWREGYLSEELELIKNTLDRFSIPFHEIFAGDKLIADTYIDDRSVSYKGNWEEVISELNKRKK